MILGLITRSEVHPQKGNNGVLGYNEVQPLPLIVVVDLLNAWIRIDNLLEASAMLKHI